MLRRPPRPLTLRWRRLRAACGLRAVCAERPGVAAEHAGSGTMILRHGCCRRAGCPTDRRMSGSLCGTNSRIVDRLTDRSSGPRAEAATAENSAATNSTAASSRSHWRRCRRGTWGERRRGADDLLSGNRGRSPAVRACQGETPASCLLLKNCLLVQYGPLAVLVSGAGHTSANGFPTGVAARIRDQTAKHITPILRLDIDECWNSGVGERCKGDVRPESAPLTGRPDYDEAHSLRLRFALDGSFPLGCIP